VKPHPDAEVCVRVAIIIPARDEAESIAGVIARVPPSLDARVIVVDNGSRDRTAEIAQTAGAEVVAQPLAGYGHACLAGVRAATGVDAAVFIDGDGSMAPEEVPHLLSPIAAGTADIVCGARRVDPRLMPWHQRAGNRLIGLLLRRLHGVHLQELGPYRAVRMTTLSSLDLQGSRYAWAAEMLARAAAQGARIFEVPVSYSERTGGRSKVGGSVGGSARAGREIIGALVRERVHPHRSPPRQ
jgi:glycosyltransferase involved in cell wall biosynthesis